MSLLLGMLDSPKMPIVVYPFFFLILVLRFFVVFSSSNNQPSPSFLSSHTSYHVLPSLPVKSFACYFHLNFSPPQMHFPFALILDTLFGMPCF